MTDIHNNNSQMKRSKKPKPLFGIFRKNKPDPVIVNNNNLGSGVSSVPLGSILNTFSSKNDPYSPPKQIKTNINQHSLLSPQFTSTNSKQQQQFQRRPRSKSVGRDPSSITNRLLEERESALNKLCSREPVSSLQDSLPLLSPTYTPPPVPPIPLCHQNNNRLPMASHSTPRSPVVTHSPRSPIVTNSPRSPITHSPLINKPQMRKFSSAHDLRKAAKLQQDSIQQAHIKPLPKKQDLNRSRSLSNTRKRWPPVRKEEEDDDDNIPLGYLQSPTSRPSSLLNDHEEDDDKDLIPIAALHIEEEYQTAADKYKEKVKQKLNINDDDDNIPISLLSLRK